MLKPNFGFILGTPKGHWLTAPISAAHAYPYPVNASLGFRINESLSMHVSNRLDIRDGSEFVNERKHHAVMHLTPVFEYNRAWNSLSINLWSSLINIEHDVFRVLSIQLNSCNEHIKMCCVFCID